MAGRDLEANSKRTTAKCTIGYWHHPLFTSGPSAGSNGLMRDIWALLYGGVDVVVTGHDHIYERYFARMRTASAGWPPASPNTSSAPAARRSTTSARSAEQCGKINRTFGVHLFHAPRHRLGLGVRRGRHRRRLQPGIGNLCHRCWRVACYRSTRGVSAVTLRVGGVPPAPAAGIDSPRRAALRAGRGKLKNRFALGGEFTSRPRTTPRRRTTPAANSGPTCSGASASRKKAGAFTGG